MGRSSGLVPGLSQVSRLVQEQSWGAEVSGNPRDPDSCLPSLQRIQGIGVLCPRCQDRCRGRWQTGFSPRRGSCRDLWEAACTRPQQLGCPWGPLSILLVPAEAVVTCPMFQGMDSGDFLSCFKQSGQRGRPVKLPFF